MFLFQVKVVDLWFLGGVTALLAYVNLEEILKLGPRILYCLGEEFYKIFRFDDVKPQKANDLV